MQKKRAVVINTFLTKPDIFLSNKPQTQSFIERQIGRIVKFAKTLKNKGKLGVQMGEILEV